MDIVKRLWGFLGTLFNVMFWHRPQLTLPCVFGISPPEAPCAASSIIVTRYTDACIISVWKNRQCDLRVVLWRFILSLSFFLFFSLSFSFFFFSLSLFSPLFFLSFFSLSFLSLSFLSLCLYFLLDIFPFPLQVQVVRWNPSLAPVLLSGGFDGVVAVLDSRSPQGVARFDLGSSLESCVWDIHEPSRFFARHDNLTFSCFIVCSFLFLEFEYGHSSRLSSHCCPH